MPETVTKNINKVIYNGEAIDLVEKSSSGLSKLEDMDENVWYEVTYKADGTVKEVKEASLLIEVDSNVTLRIDKNMVVGDPSQAQQPAK